MAQLHVYVGRDESICNCGHPKMSHSPLFNVLATVKVCLYTCHCECFVAQDSWFYRVEMPDFPVTDPSAWLR